jgi:hypothetical protein
MNPTDPLAHLPGLTDALARYPFGTPGTPLMRESIRTVRRKLIRGSGVPQGGAYWWVPRRTAGGLGWGVVEFYDRDYRGGTGHGGPWQHVLELLAVRWRKDPVVLLKFLGAHPAALPRGRVEGSPAVAAGRPVVTWRVTHGDDAPVESSRGVLLRAFGLTAAARAGRVEFAADPDVRANPAACRRLQTALGVDLGLGVVGPGPSP